jgi:uncharacterized membrane protein YozB (DUF420 family)
MFNIDSMAIKQKDNIGKIKDKKKKKRCWRHTRALMITFLVLYIKKNLMKQIYRYHVNYKFIYEFVYKFHGIYKFILLKSLWY